MSEKISDEKLHKALGKFLECNTKVKCLELTLQEEKEKQKESICVITRLIKKEQKSMVDQQN